jgi:hypothetical protein
MTKEEKEREDEEKGHSVNLLLLYLRPSLSLTFPSFVIRFATLKPVPVTPNMTTTNPIGMNASHGTGMVMECLQSMSEIKVRSCEAYIRPIYR